MKIKIDLKSFIRRDQIYLDLTEAQGCFIRYRQMAKAGIVRHNYNQFYFMPLDDMRKRRIEIEGNFLTNVWRQEGDDGGRNESGDGADGAGYALQNAGILRRQVDVTQEKSAHDGDLTTGLTQRQEEDGHVTISGRQLTYHEHTQRRQHKTLKHIMQIYLY